ncbi:hypothetical protein, partial [Pseudomonas sp. FEN]
MTKIIQGQLNRRGFLTASSIALARWGCRPWC